MPRHYFEVQEENCSGHWENGWTDSPEDGEDRPLVFNTQEEANEEILDLLKSVKEAVTEGNMSEEYDPDSFRVVEVIEDDDGDRIMEKVVQ